MFLVVAVVSKPNQYFLLVSFRFKIREIMYTIICKKLKIKIKYYIFFFTKTLKVITALKEYLKYNKTTNKKKYLKLFYVMGRIIVPFRALLSFYYSKLIAVLSFKRNSLHSQTKRKMFYKP